VGPYVASFEVYFKGFIEHLAFVKLRHWDQDIRKISAAALSLMTCLNPQFMVEDIL
jgi:tubulin-specific chaperone D